LGDEAPEFRPAALDALRQPLEAGVVSIHRANAVAHFPARFQLVMAANPCPCGQYGATDSDCVCTPHVRRKYLARLSGPLMDRIDIQLRVSRVTAVRLRLGDETPTITSAAARRRVTDARSAADGRLQHTPWRLNSEVPGAWLRSRERRLSAATTVSIDRALERGGLTMRGYDRVLRLHKSYLLQMFIPKVPGVLSCPCNIRATSLFAVKVLDPSPVLSRNRCHVRSVLNRRDPHPSRCRDCLSHFSVERAGPLRSKVEFVVEGK
jgi:hypothetical protein